MGRLGRILLDELLAAVAAQAGDAILEEKVWALQHLYAAILYQGARREAAESSQDRLRTSNDQWKQVRRRLQLAEAGRWKQVFSEYAAGIVATMDPGVDWLVEQGSENAEQSEKEGPCGKQGQRRLCENRGTTPQRRWFAPTL